MLGEKSGGWQRGFYLTWLAARKQQYHICTVGHIRSLCAAFSRALV